MGLHPNEPTLHEPQGTSLTHEGRALVREAIALGQPYAHALLVQGERQVMERATPASSEAK